MAASTSTDDLGAWPCMFVCEKCGFGRATIWDLRKHLPKCFATRQYPIVTYGALRIRWINVTTPVYKNPQPFATPVCVDCRGSVNTSGSKHSCFMNGPVDIQPQLKVKGSVEQQLKEQFRDTDSDFE